jgi:hypothetical protein
VGSWVLYAALFASLDFRVLFLKHKPNPFLVMQNTSEKYPVLTAWLGIMATMLVGALLCHLPLI